jgi:hypothetical protein
MFKSNCVSPPLYVECRGFRCVRRSCSEPILSFAVGLTLHSDYHGTDCRGDFDCDSATANVWNASQEHVAVADKLLHVARAQFGGDHLPPD